MLYCPMKIHCPNRKLTGCSLCVPAAQISVRYLAFYDDPEKRARPLNQYISANAPDIQVEAIDGIVERLWVVSEPDIIARVQESMSQKKIYIADGHHRYETALTYRNERIRMNPGHTGNEPYNFVMMMMVEMDDGLAYTPNTPCNVWYKGYRAEGGYGKSS